MGRSASGSWQLPHPTAQQSPHAVITAHAQTTSDPQATQQRASSSPFSHVASGPGAGTVVIHFREMGKPAPTDVPAPPRWSTGRPTGTRRLGATVICATLPLGNITCRTTPLVAATAESRAPSH